MDSGSVVLVLKPGQPGRQALDRDFEVWVEVDESTQPVGYPAQGDILAATALFKFFDPPICEVHGLVRKSFSDKFALLPLVRVRRAGCGR